MKIIDKILLVIYSLLFWKIVDCLLVSCQTTGIDNQDLSKYVIIVLYIIDTTIDENNLQQIDLLRYIWGAITDVGQ